VAQVTARTGFTAADADRAAEVQQALEALRRASATEPAAVEPQGAQTSDTEPAALEPQTADATDAARDEDAAAIVGAELSATVPLPTEAAPPLPEAFAPELSPAPASEAVLPEFLQDPLADIRDDVDEQVLPIFLEEAAELYPQASAQVREWRRAPATPRAPGSCGACCTRSRAARGWRARCAWASSRT